MSARRVVIQVDFRAHAALRPTTTPSAVDSPTAPVLPLRRRVSAVDEQRGYALYLEASAIDEKSEHYDQAEELYRRAIAADPMLAAAYVNLGNIRFRRGDEAGALLLYGQALSVDPQQPDAHHNRGYIRLEQGDARGAITEFEQALAADPRFAYAQFNMAMACEQVGDHPKACTHWRNYLKLEPTGTYAYVARKHLDVEKKAEDKRSRAQRRTRPKHVERPEPGSGVHLPGIDEWLTKQPRRDP